MLPQELSIIDIMTELSFCSCAYKLQCRNKRLNYAMFKEALTHLTSHTHTYTNNQL